MSRRSIRAIYQPDSVEAELIVPVPSEASAWRRMWCDLLGHRFTDVEQNVYYNSVDARSDCGRRCGAQNPAWTGWRPPTSVGMDA